MNKEQEFKVEELEQRLEMGEYRFGSDCPQEDVIQICYEEDIP